VVFEVALVAAGIVAGGIAAVSGFGIGSVLTPLLALRVGTRLAVAAVAIPHLLGTALRFWLLHGHVDRRTFVWFGLTSAAGGLTGALLHDAASSRALSVVFGCLLLFVAASELTGLMSHVRFGRSAAWIAGALSGLLGGLVGNQGGIRSAALLGFGLQKEAFVETAAAIGLVVDVARLPVYMVTDGSDLQQIAPLIALAAAGVLTGTIAGFGLLRNIPERRFRRVVAILLALLGGWMLAGGGASAPPLR
jgi:uncharacterized membrane protein YfcA